MDQFAIILAISAGLMNSDNFSTREETVKSLPFCVAKMLCCHSNLEVAHLSKCCCDQHLNRIVAEFNVEMWPRLDVILDKREAYLWAYAFAGAEEEDFVEINISHLRLAGKVYCQNLLRKGMSPSSVKKLIDFALWYERDIWGQRFKHGEIPMSKLSDETIKSVASANANYLLSEEIINQIRGQK